METYIRDLIIAVNTGLHMRPTGVVGALAVANEWTLGVGAPFLPLRDGRLRVGGSLTMSTGTETLKGQPGSPNTARSSRRETPRSMARRGTHGPRLRRGSSGCGRTRN